MLKEYNKTRKTKIYGSRRLAKLLQEKHNIQLSRRQVQLMMQKHHLFAKIRLQKFKYYKEEMINIYEENLINNDYQASNSLQKWVMDIKYIKTLEGILYLNIIRDVYSQSIISYKMSKAQRFATLVKPCIEQAIKLFDSKVDNVILHTDNGVQYRCYDFYELTTKHNIKTSKSRTHTSTDNGFAENWFSHLSAEWIKNCVYQNFEQAEIDIKAYINFYNHERIFMKFKSSPWNNIKFTEK